MQKKIYIICSLLLLSIFYTHFAFGQGVAGFQFSKPKQKFARIPFQLHNNLIIIPVLLNQSKDTLRFILDTGVGNTILIDSSFIKKLAIDTQSRKVFIKGSGLGEQISTYIAPLQKMSVQQLIAPNTNILVCEKTLTYISEYAGITIHGIVGYDFFANLVVTIDYEQKELRVFNVEYFNKKAKKIPENQLYPIKIQKKKPYIKASISYDTSQNIPIQLLMDTGAGHSLSLDENHQKQIKLPNKTIESSLGLAINGIVSGKIGRISKLCIGENYCWEQVISSFPDTLLIAYRDEKVDKQGSIGIGILERFVLTLDYTHQRCMLKPSKKYKNNFEIGFSGIELLMQIEPKKVFIASVHPLSEAYKAGLQAGDEVLALNDKVIRNFSLGDLYDFLDKKEGRQIYLLVKRKEELIVMAFKTKKLI